MRKKNPNQPSRNNRLNLTLSDEEKKMVLDLKKKYSINISNFIRESIKKMYEKVKKVNH
jgi:hypothetical protein